MARVCVLYTGGTIGCRGDPLTPMPGSDFEALMLAVPALSGHRLESYDVGYTLEAYPEPLDSSNMTPHDWVRIARTILSVYEAYDGFVVLHGTDTMSWTASALSFLLMGLSKPVVVTGSQLPLGVTLSDAHRNLLTSLAIAGTRPIPEVCLFFNKVLLRGNRSVKVDATDFSAFASPNFPALGTAGITIDVDARLVLAPPRAEVTLDTPANLAEARRRLDRMDATLSTFSVVVLALFPGIPPSMLRALFQDTVPSIRGVVLQAFGEGNAPSNPEFLQALAAAHGRGVVIVDGTQVLRGKVGISAYQTGTGLRKIGALSASDLTPEAALTKLVYLLALGYGQAEVEQRMLESLCGEVTSF